MGNVDNTVWVVIYGEKHEGGSILSVHWTRDGALTAALSLTPHFDGGWKEEGPNYWENGCDFVRAEHCEVIE